MTEIMIFLALAYTFGFVVGILMALGDRKYMPPERKTPVATLKDCAGMGFVSANIFGFLGLLAIYGAIAQGAR